SAFVSDDTEPSEIYTLSLHDALPILVGTFVDAQRHALGDQVLNITALVVLFLIVADHPHGHTTPVASDYLIAEAVVGDGVDADIDRKSTRLNSSHVKISYAVFCLKKK